MPRDIFKRSTADLIMEILRHARHTLTGDEIHHALVERGHPVERATQKQSFTG